MLPVFEAVATLLFSFEAVPAMRDACYNVPLRLRAARNLTPAAFCSSVF